MKYVDSRGVFIGFLKGRWVRDLSGDDVGEKCFCSNSDVSALHTFNTSYSAEHRHAADLGRNQGKYQWNWLDSLVIFNLSSSADAILKK